MLYRITISCLKLTIAGPCLSREKKVIKSKEFKRKYRVFNTRNTMNGQFYCYQINLHQFEPEKNREIYFIDTQTHTHKVKLKFKLF